MTYMYQSQHAMLIHSCKFISICILMCYVFNSVHISPVYTFVREYYFGL